MLLEALFEMLSHVLIAYHPARIEVFQPEAHLLLVPGLVLGATLGGGSLCIICFHRALLWSFEFHDGTAKPGGG